MISVFLAYASNEEQTSVAVQELLEAAGYPVVRRELPIDVFSQEFAFCEFLVIIQNLGKSEALTSEVIAAANQANKPVFFIRSHIYSSMSGVVANYIPGIGITLPILIAKNNHIATLKELQQLLGKLDTENAKARTVVRRSGPIQDFNGVLIENVPRLMRSRVSETVEVRISREDTEALMTGVKGKTHKHDIITTSAMTVSLQAPDGGFAIQSLSRETQWIDGGHKTQLGLVGQANYGCWKWIVTPLQRGTYCLNIVAAAKTANEEGIEAETLLPEQVIQVRVRVNYIQTTKQVGQWLVIGAAGGLVAEYANDFVNLIRKSFF
jgi:hypothetical protein